MGHAARALDPRARHHLDLGTIQLARGSIRQAIWSFEQALRLDPSSAEPRSWLGHALVKAARRVPSRDEMLTLLIWAERVLLEALEIDWQARRARGALRQVGAVLHAPSRRGDEHLEAHIVEGHRHFGRGELAAARRCYERAMAHDERHADAWKYAGNCHFSERSFDAAAHHFQQACARDPNDAQAHVFLADTCLERRDYTAMWHALYGAIAAHPRYWSAWLRLDELLLPIGRRLTRFRLTPTVRITKQDGEPRFVIDAMAPPHLAAAWSAYASSIAEAPPDRSAYDTELRALTALVEHIIATRRRSTAPAFPPALQLLQHVHESGALEPAVLLLRYDESFRDPFEAWKRDNPNGVKRFAMRFKLRPL